MNAVETFIGRFKCKHELCDGLIDYYNQNKKFQKPGEIGGNKIDKAMKESTDLVIHPDLERVPIIEEYFHHLEDCLEEYMKKYSALNKLYKFGLCEPFIIQKYKPGQGFKQEHCERVGVFDSSIKRVLVFMTYLNDVDDGGTHFTYYNLTEKAQKGKTLIWCSDWTHTHKGQISETQEKIIATGWLSHQWDFQH